MTQTSLVIADEREIRRLALGYARGADRRDGAIFGAQFAPDAVLEGSNFRYATPAEISSVPDALRVFEKTYHTLLNSNIDVDGDSATGEIYSLAHHLTPRTDGKHDDLVMHITYRDQYARTADGWRIKHRLVVVEFNENRIVERIDR